MNYGSLASTGTGLAIGGVILSQTQLVGIAIGAIVLGALLVRITFRRGKSPLEV
jgi:hypothetical protein